MDSFSMKTFSNMLTGHRIHIRRPRPTTESRETFEEQSFSIRSSPDSDSTQMRPSSWQARKMAMDWYEKLIGNYNRSSERIQQALAKRKFRTVQSSEEIVKCSNGKVAVKKQRHLSVVYYI